MEVGRREAHTHTSGGDLIRRPIFPRPAPVLWRRPGRSGISWHLTLPEGKSLGLARRVPLPAAHRQCGHSRAEEAKGLQPGAQKWHGTSLVQASVSVAAVRI